MTATETHSPLAGPRAAMKRDVASAVLVITHRSVPVRHRGQEPLRVIEQPKGDGCRFRTAFRLLPDAVDVGRDQGDLAPGKKAFQCDADEDEQQHRGHHS